jgi:hypothetical protein
MNRIATRPLPCAPDLLALHASRRDLFPALLQSSAREGWDILFALPETSRVYSHAEAADFLHDLAGLPHETALDTVLPFSGGWLEYPQYTRPAEFRGWTVPDVLLSGHHAEIARWRAEQARRRTAERRPDLLAAPETGQTTQDHL